MWHHFVGTYDSSTGDKKIYVDGELKDIVNISGAISADTGPVQFAHQETTPIGDANHFNGIIDDIRIYNRALSNSEIQQIYNEESLNLTIFPSSGKLATTSGFDLTLIVQTPTLSVVDIIATLDGYDVSNPLLGCVKAGTLFLGGETFRCSGLKAGTHLEVGTHTLNVTVDLDDGSSVSDEVTWEVLKNRE